MQPFFMLCLVLNQNCMHLCIINTTTTTTTGEDGDCDAKALLHYNPSLYRLVVLIRFSRRKATKFSSLILDHVKTLINCWYQKEHGSVNIACIHCTAQDSEGRFDPFIFSLEDIELTAAQGMMYCEAY